MVVYLIRHAHAWDGEDDAARPVSKKGLRQISALGRFLRGSGSLATEEVWHSPLARSRQTAKLMVKRLKLRAKLVEVSGLTPEAEPALVAKRLARCHESLAIVGHEPHLSALASLLVAGSQEPPLFVLKKCAVLALKRSGTHWQVLWQVSPDVI